MTKELKGTWGNWIVQLIWEYFNIFLTQWLYCCLFSEHYPSLQESKLGSKSLLNSDDGKKCMKMNSLLPKGKGRRDKLGV